MISSSQVTTKRQTQQQQEKQEKENFNQENKDDWRVNDDDNVNQDNICIETPSFIRLFVIRCIIDKYISNNKDKKKEKTKEEIIKGLANVFKDNKKTESLVINIVTRLINDGIKKYMDKYYNEKEQANIIEDIFNKIILEKFLQEYNEMIKCGINNDKTNNNCYQNLLFNSSDLMNQIFQYLEWGEEFDEDLYSCSLVSSHWLYHVWNPNSVYFVKFNKVVKDDISNSRNWARIWQRLYNVKSIKIEFHLKNSKAALAKVNKLSMFRNADEVEAVASGDQLDKCISALIAIMSRCKDRIKYCRVGIESYGFDASYFDAPSISPLMLPKAQYVEIRDVFFYRIWTNKCTKLMLCSTKNISKDWCKFVIENCDCSNTSNLILDRVMFDDELILKHFAMKFKNLKTLEIKIDKEDYDSVILFWELLKPIISKNKTQVKLKMNNSEDDQAILLSETMDEKGLKIDELIIGYMNSNDDAVNNAIKFIQERDNRGLNHLTIKGAMSGNATLTQELLNEFKIFQSIHMS